MTRADTKNALADLLGLGCVGDILDPKKAPAIGMFPVMTAGRDRCEDNWSVAIRPLSVPRRSCH